MRPANRAGFAHPQQKRLMPCRLGPVRSTMRLTLALLALALLVSGCSSHAPPASGTQGGTGAPGAGTPGATPALPTRDVSLYKFDALVTGGSAPTPADTGGAADQVPLAKTDTFTVANGTLSLSIAGDLNTGSGSGRIEIYAPEI